MPALPMPAAVRAPFVHRAAPLLIGPATEHYVTLTCLLGRCAVPPKVRDLIEELEQAGFVNRGGKGSHRNFVHPHVSRPVTLSGKPSEDAKPYQVRAVRLAMREIKS